MKLNTTTLTILIVGVLLACSLNYQLASFFSRPYAHLVAAEQSVQTANADLALEGALQRNLRELQQRNRPIPKAERVSMVVREMHETAKRTGVLITFLEVNATPSVGLSGSLAAILRFLDGMREWRQPLRVVSIGLGGTTKDLEATINAAY